MKWWWALTPLARWLVFLMTGYAVILMVLVWGILSGPRVGFNRAADTDDDLFLFWHVIMPAVHMTMPQ